jgi:adenosylmethionine-8-amino-7-oxononanoate aminotransferase
MHAQTYLQSPAMTSAGLATLEYFEKHSVVQNSEKMGKLLHELLSSEVLTHPNVGCVSGIGLLAGLEFVEDRERKRPFDRARKTAEKFTQHAFNRGLIFWPNVGQADGVNGDLIMITPPLTIREEEVRELVRELRAAIDAFF